RHSPTRKVATTTTRSRDRSLPQRRCKDKKLCAPCPLPEALVSVVARAVCRASFLPARGTVAIGTRCHPSGATASRRPLASSPSAPSAIEISGGPPTQSAIATSTSGASCAGITVWASGCRSRASCPDD
ncbi:unnamed protein product, partial [Ectocarpus sp. 6 AP-2014]